MTTIGLTPLQLIGEGFIPTTNFDIYQTYEYGRSLVNPKSLSSLGIQMYLLNKLYLRVCDNEEAWLIVTIRPEHYVKWRIICLGS